MIWLDQPHHDGSSLYVAPGPYGLGDIVPVRVRVPKAAGVDQVVLRAVLDGEPILRPARRDRDDDADTWWIAELELANPVVSYRFALERPGSGRWLNSAGVSSIDVRDAADFRLSTHPTPPAWLADSVGYQIFPDRFACRGPRPTPPAWAEPAEWEDSANADGRRGVRQWYGGDLAGIEDHLDHLRQLGVDLIYLTPFFPAHSSHRYDATTFDHVDPLLGGDAALASLTSAAHARHMRVIGDLTLNHTGNHHDWFQRAQLDPSSPEAGFYVFGRHPEEYTAWYGVPSLPKLDHRSAELRRRLIDGPDSVAGRWLAAPYELDGWRIDCANTTARLGATDLNADVALTMRATLAAVRPDAWLVAEHCYDAAEDLDGSGWHGVMAYQWFTRPIAQWLATVDEIRMMSARPVPPLDAVAAVATMRTLAAGVPWTAYAASMTMLDSHDSPRFRSLVGGDPARHAAAFALLFTFPGVPTIFAGSEVGVLGDNSDSGRVPFPWDPARWDHHLLATVGELIAVRRASPALRHGGLRWIHADADSITFLRETDDERILVQVARTSGTVRLPAAPLMISVVEHLHGPRSARAERDQLVFTGGPGAGIWRIAG
jgi:alpha-glucosidase